jgi:hypothetical protein
MPNIKWLIRNRAWSAMILAFGGCQMLSGQPRNGKICVAPISSEPPMRASSPDAIYNPATLSVKIDSGALMLWPHKESMPVTDLKLEQRHLISVWSDGKRIQSLWFRFSEYGNDLCLTYDAYDLIQLRDRKSSRSCNCK